MLKPRFRHHPHHTSSLEKQPPGRLDNMALHWQTNQPTHPTEPRSNMTVADPFPPLPTGTLPLTLKDLPTYIREFNSTHVKKVLLHVYLAPGHESRSITIPVILRFLIPNVLRAFITLGYEEGIYGAVPEMPALVVESFT